MDGLFALGGLVLFLGWVAAPWVAMARARRAREATETNEQRVHELQRRLTELHKKTQEPKAGQSEQVKDEFDRLRAQVMALQEEKRAWLLERDGLLAALLQAGGKAPEQAAPAEVVEAKVAPDPFAQAEWKKFAQEPLERRAEKALHGEPQHGQQTHQKSAFEHQRKLEKKQQKHAHGEHKHRDAPGDVAAMQARLEDQRKEAEGQPPLELQEVPAQAQVIEAVPVEALKPATPKVPPRPPPPPKGPSAGERARERWRSQVRPILLENVGWFIGGFLVIAGSIYFIQEAWGGFQALGRHILLVAVALAYAGAFVGVGVWFKSKYNLNTASHAMATVGLCLLPVAMISAADIHSAGWLPWAIGAPIAWGLAYPIAYLGAGLLDRTLARQLGFAIWSLLALIVSARAAGALSPALALGLPYLGWVIAHRASSEPLHGAKPPQTSALGFHLAALAYTLAFLIGLSRVVAGDVAGIPWAAATGPLAVLVAFTALRVDVELRARWDKAPELDTALILAFCSAVGGVTATAGSPPIFALAAALASALMAVALVWFRLRLFVLLAIGAATLSLWALLFLSQPMATLLPQLGGALAALTGLAFFRSAATFAFLLLPIVHGARALARRFELRDEPRLAGAARLSAWLVLFAVIAVGSFTSDVRGAAPTLLVCALVLFAWHRQKPGRLTAWSATLALTAGLLLLLLALGRSPADALVKTALVLAAMSLANLPRPGLRIGSAALLQAALAVSAVSLFLDVGNGPAEVLPHLWLTAGLWMLAGLAHGATGMGFIGLAALGGAVAWTLTGLTAWPAFTPALARDPTLPRLLIVPAIYVGIGMGGQWLARHWRGLASLPFGKTPLEDRVRSLHALSIPALLLATPVLLALTVGALASAIVTANGPAAWMLATLGLLFLVHAYTSRQALTSVLGTIALVAAASIGLSDMLAPTFRAWLINPTRDTQPDLPINVSDGGLSAVAALVLWRAFSWKRAPRYRRLQTAGVRTAMVLFYLAHAAAFVTALGSLAPLFGQPAARPNELRLAEYALLMLLGAGAAQLALRQTLGELSRWFALVSLLFAGALLPEAIGLPPTLVAPVYGGLAIALTLAARLGAFEKARDLFPPARIGAALAAALALTTSFLPPQTPFVAPGFWHHVASDALLCAW
ncbi:MAG: hypothetical protein JST92_15645, partial [Deltaproteobacteria bacterium]|nr:hypothetical protein [Deltaproteobacteria bacterium]